MKSDASDSRGKPMIDWAQSRLGRKWLFGDKYDIDTRRGEVITARETVFGPRGLRVTVDKRAPWFPISLGERTVDAAKFHVLRVRARSSEPGRILLRTHSPGYRSHVRAVLDPAMPLRPEWRTLTVDLRKARLIAPGRGGRSRGPVWGGADGLLDRIYFHLDVPLNRGVIVEIASVCLLGEGSRDDTRPG